MLRQIGCWNDNKVIMYTQYEVDPAAAAVCAATVTRRTAPTLRRIYFGYRTGWPNGDSKPLPELLTAYSSTS